MKKNDDILKLAEKYLELKDTMEKWKYLKTVEAKVSKANFKTFLFWQSDVERHESHKASMQTKKWYLDRLTFFLSPEYKARNKK